MLPRINTRDLLPPHHLHLIHDFKHFPVHLDQLCASPPKPLIMPHLTLYLTERSVRDNTQPRPAFLAGTDNHAAMELALSASASRLSTFALEIIDRSFDHKLIGEEGLDKLPDLVGESNKRLPKSTEFLPVCLILYAHYYISIQIIMQIASEKSTSLKKLFPLG